MQVSRCCVAWTQLFVRVCRSSTATDSTPTDARRTAAEDPWMRAGGRAGCVNAMEGGNAMSMDEDGWEWVWAVGRCGAGLAGELLRPAGGVSVG